MRWYRATGAVAAAAAVLLVFGCAPRKHRTERLNGRTLVCTTYPVWLCTRAVTDGRPGVTVERLLPAGLGCPHEHVVTPEEMGKLESADILVVNGLGLDGFAEEAVRHLRKDVPVIVATRDIGELLPYDDEEEHHHKEHDHVEERMNPHLFASPGRVARMLRTISRQLGSLDPAGKELYTGNASRREAQMLALAREMASAAQSLSNKKIITQHDVFAYLAHDAGLEVVAVITTHPGESPSAAEMLNLVRTARQAGAGAIFTEPQYPEEIGRTIARETGIPHATLDPVASGPDDGDLAYYERVMRRNVRVLLETLGKGK